MDLIQIEDYTNYLRKKSPTILSLLFQMKDINDNKLIVFYIILE